MDVLKCDHNPWIGRVVQYDWTKNAEPKLAKSIALGFSKWELDHYARPLGIEILTKEDHDRQINEIGQECKRVEDSAIIQWKKHFDQWYIKHPLFTLHPEPLSNFGFAFDSIQPPKIPFKPINGWHATEWISKFRKESSKKHQWTMGFAKEGIKEEDVSQWKNHIYGAKPVKSWYFDDSMSLWSEKVGKNTWMRRSLFHYYHTEIDSSFSWDESDLLWDHLFFAKLSIATQRMDFEKVPWSSFVPIAPEVDKDVETIYLLSRFFEWFGSSSLAEMPNKSTILQEISSCIECFVAKKPEVVEEWKQIFRAGFGKDRHIFHHPIDNKDYVCSMTYFDVLAEFASFLYDPDQREYWACILSVHSWIHRPSATPSKIRLVTAFPLKSNKKTELWESQWWDIRHRYEKGDLLFMVLERYGYDLQFTEHPLKTLHQYKEICIRLPFSGESCTINPEVLTPFAKYSTSLRQALISRLYSLKRMYGKQDKKAAERDWNSLWINNGWTVAYLSLMWTMYGSCLEEGGDGVVLPFGEAFMHQTFSLYSKYISEKDNRARLMPIYPMVMPPTEWADHSYLGYLEHMKVDISPLAHIKKNKTDKFYLTWTEFRKETWEELKRYNEFVDPVKGKRRENPMRGEELAKYRQMIERMSPLELLVFRAKNTAGFCIGSVNSVFACPIDFAADKKSFNRYLLNHYWAWVGSSQSPEVLGRLNETDFILDVESEEFMDDYIKQYESRSKMFSKLQ